METITGVADDAAEENQRKEKEAEYVPKSESIDEDSLAYISQAIHSDR